MVKTTTKEDIKELSISQYDRIRNTIKSGDLFFTSGNYLISQAIRKVTKSPWSHVGVIFKLESIDRVLLLESVEDMGVRLAPLSKYLSDYERNKPYRGEIVLARCSGVKEDTINGLAKSGIDELTKPYDKDEIAKILARIALGRKKWKRDREYICSELVYECFSKVDINFNFDTRGFISPENIWQDEKVKFVSRIL